MATTANLETFAKLRRLAARIRLNALEMVAIQGFGYLGQAFSSAEIFAALFGLGLIRLGRDRFVLSPAHYVVSLYAVAAEIGLLAPGALATYGRDGSQLEAIGTERTPLVDLVCGSLGQGLSGAIGFAIASHLAGERHRAGAAGAGAGNATSSAAPGSVVPRVSGENPDTWAFLSDGEMEEGQVWEAAMFASHNRDRMGRLIAVIDANNSQVDGPVTSVTTLEPLAEKWRSFGWQVAEVDGHDVAALSHALAAGSGALEAGRHASAPSVVIARTQTSGRLRSLPQDIDRHFIKLDAALQRALRSELEAQLV